MIFLGEIELFWEFGVGFWFCLWVFVFAFSGRVEILVRVLLSFVFYG